MKHRIFTFNQSCTRAGKVLTDSQMEAFHNHTFEGDDYPDDVQLHEGTTEELIKYNQRELEIDKFGTAFRHKVARNVLRALNSASQHG